MIDLIHEVWSELGPGYSESIYHNALEVSMRLAGIQYETERIIPVKYKGHVIGNLRADIILADTIVELKSVRSLTEPNRDQIRTYMKILGYTHGILVNFGSDLQIEEIRLSE
jgi:GxxExxY protein